MTNEQAKSVLNEWLDKCYCENLSHDIKDIKNHKTYLYLRPAINHEFKSDMLWMQEQVARFKNAADFIRFIQTKIIWQSTKYDYSKTPPIMCQKCAEANDLKIHEKWRIAADKTFNCDKCGGIWNPYESISANGIFKHNTKILCAKCYAATQPLIKTEETAKFQKDLENTPTTDRQTRDKIRREINDEILEQYLENTPCCKCGNDNIKDLSALPTKDSPKGKVWQWRRDDNNDSFKQKLNTTKVYCNDCRPTPWDTVVK